jgi:hypothetical protein
MASDARWVLLSSYLDPEDEVYRNVSFVPNYVALQTRRPQRMSSSGMLRCVALVRTDVSQELSASIIRVTRIGKLGTFLVHLFLLP